MLIIWRADPTTRGLGLKLGSRWDSSRALPAGRGGRARFTVLREEESVRVSRRSVAGYPIARWLHQLSARFGLLRRPRFQLVSQLLAFEASSGLACRVEVRGLCLQDLLRARAGLKTRPYGGMGCLYTGRSGVSYRPGGLSRVPGDELHSLAEMLKASEGGVLRSYSKSGEAVLV